MRRERKKKRIIIFSLITVLFLMVVGYAAFQTKLEIKGTSNISSEWRIEITNVLVSNKNGLGENVNFEHTKTMASMEANLYEKGDYVEYDVEVSNLGTLDAEIDNIANNIKSTNKAVKISFSGYAKGQVLKAKQKQTIKVKIEYDSNFSGDVPEGPAEVEVQPEYVQHNPGGTTPLPDRYLVSYDCISNGGKDCSENNEYLTEGDEINLNPSGVKEGYTFVGWNTNKSATSGLTSLSMEKSNITLYAIYKANITSIETLTATLSETTYTYDGSAKTPSVTIKNGNTTLVKDTDYTVTYKNNTNAGTATVTITGKGKYNGTITKTFKINKANGEVKLSAASGNIVYGTASKTFTISSNKSGGALSVSDDNSTATSSISSNTVTIGSLSGLAAGTKVIVTVTSAATDNYNLATAKYTLTVNKANPTVSLTAKTATYSGSAIAANTATVSPSTGGALSYVYYSDSSCSTQVTTATGASAAGAAPKNAGTYYVKATVAATTNYNSASSICTKHTINKATPTITLSATSGTVVKGKTLTFNEKASVAGKFSNASNNTNVATVSPATSSSAIAAGTNDTVTVTGVANGTANITVNFTPTDTTNYNNASAKTFAATITNSATKPTAASYCQSLIYNGSSQTLTKAAGSGYTFSNNTRTNAGSQTVTATLANGYRWSDNSTAAVTFSCSIAKATPTITLSATSGTVVKGKTLTFNEKASVAGKFTNASSNTNVATVSPTTSSSAINANTNTAVTVTGVANGTANITVNFTPTDTTNYNNASTKTYAVTITNSATKPTAASYCQSLTYNGSSQTLTKAAGSGYTFSNNTRTNAGSQTVTATLSNGYRWSDNTTGNVTFSCSIAKATPTITLSASSGTVVKGKTLTFNEKASVAGKFTNANNNTDVATVSPATSSEAIAAGTNSAVTVTGVANGTANITVNFTPTDTTNYNNASTKTYAVTITNSATKPTAANYCQSLTYNGSSQTLTKAAGAGYTFSNNTRTNAGSQTVTATLSNGYRWSDNTTGNVTFSCSIAKATPTITLSATNGTVVKGKTLTFNEKASVAGKFSNASNNTNIATVSPATSSSAIAAGTNSAVTVTGVTNGTANITVNFTPTDTTNYNNASAKTYSATITNSATKPTAANYCQSLTYNGSSQTLTKAAGSGYTFSNNTRTNAGSQTVTATLSSGYRWSDNTTGNVTFSCSIAKATPTITLSASSGTVVKGKTLTFNEKASVAGKFTNASNNTDVATVSPATSSEAIAAGTNSAVTVTGVANGSANITVNFTPTDTTNYNNASVKTFAATITNSATKPTAASYCQSLTYNGSSQTLTKAAGSGYTFSNNTRTNAGSQTVTATLSNDYRWSDNSTGNVTFSCSINKAAGAVTLSASSGSVNYGTASKTFTVSNNKSGGSLSVSDDNSIATSSISSNTVTIGSLGSLTAGTKVVVTVTSAATDNYNLATAKYTLTVNKVTPTVSLTAKTATYSGSAIVANTATVSPSTGGALSYIYYSDSSCSTKVTTSTGASATGAAPKNAGTYYVKATVAATTNYNGASSACTKHTINKKADTITLSAKSTTYTGSAIAANTATATSGSAITYTYYGSTDCSGTALTSTPINVGNYSVKAVSAGNGNYSSGSKCVTHTITQGTPTISLTAKTATYTGSAITANTATAKAPNGSAVTLTYTYKYYSDNTCSTQVTTSTGASATGAAPKNVGTYYVKATSTATTNLKAASSSCVAHTINKKAPTLNLSATTASVGYNNGTSNVTYTYDGDGAVSCTSSNTSYATCSVNTSTKTITITGKAYTTTEPTITIKAAAGTNYSAATDKTITVTLTDGVKPTVSLSPNTQSTYVSGGKAVTVTLADAGSGLKASQTVSYAWSTSSTTAPTSFTNLTTSNSAGAASAIVTVPASASASLTGTYYLWIKVGTVADVSGNTNAVKTSGAFKFDNTKPSGSITFTGTTGTVNDKSGIYLFGSSVGAAPYASSSTSDSHSGVKTSSLTCTSGNTNIATVSNASTSKVNVSIKSRKGTTNSWHYLQEYTAVTCTLSITDNAGNTNTASKSANFGNGWYSANLGNLCSSYASSSELNYTNKNNYKGVWNYINGMNRMTGWVYTYWYKTNNTVYYYLDSSGTMLRDWQKIDGKWYYFVNTCNWGSNYYSHSGYAYPDGGMMWSDTVYRKSDGSSWSFNANGQCTSGSGC